MIPQSEQATILHAAFDQTGVTFHNRAAALAELKAGGREITFDNGQPTTHYDGQTLPLGEVLLRFAYDRRDLIDGRTLPREGVGTTRPGLQSKSDFPTTASKIEAIAKFGEDWWARLPLTSPSPNGEVLTREDFLRLPSAEKVKRYATDEHAFTRLPNAPKSHPFRKALGQKEQMAANLALDVAKRGGRR